MSKILIKEGEMFRSRNYKIVLLKGEFRLQKKLFSKFKTVFSSPYISHCMAQMNVMIKDDEKTISMSIKFIIFAVVSFVIYMGYNLFSGL